MDMQGIIYDLKGNYIGQTDGDVDQNEEQFMDEEQEEY